MAVMIHHFWPKTGPLSAGADIAHLGWVGVDLFFVISGCLIAGILLDTRADHGYFLNFYARRALRIFPLYMLFVAAAYLAIPRLQAGGPHAGEFLRESGPAWWYVCYVGNFREAFTGTAPAYVLAPTWSLCIEEQFYVLFPILLAFIAPRRLSALLWGLVVFAPLFRIVTAFAWPANERVQYLATPARVDVLALGCLIAVGARGYAWLPAPRTVAILLPCAIASCGVAYAFGGLDRTTLVCRTGGYSLIGLTAFLLVVWAVQRRMSGTTAWLRYKPLCQIGVICYGVYLLQRPAEVLLGKGLGRLAPEFDFDSGLGVILKCIAAIAAAVLSWNLVEKPCLGLKRFFISAQHPGDSPKRAPV